ncbi:MAG TPA: hypothetical protein VFL27_15785 [Candidatus Dormibacteraeota bacterium]|nr:hypothetical protein [Candidatus Dormibacteraeota bacterium]
MVLPARLVFATAATAYADANPNNRGHHYGQQKHQHPAPTPAPTPAPQPSAHPTPAIVPPQSTVTQPAITPAAHQPAAAPTPAVTVPSPVSNRARITEPVAPAGADDWLLLLVLPTLIAVWLIAALGLARLASRLGKPAREVRTAPAPS